MVRLEEDNEIAAMAVNLTNQIKDETYQVATAAGQARKKDANKIIANQSGNQYEVAGQERHKARGAIIRVAQRYLSTQDS